MTGHKQIFHITREGYPVCPIVAHNHTEALEKYVRLNSAEYTITIKNARGEKKSISAVVSPSVSLSKA